MTRDGWYFLCVLLFVMGGAVARELNLLVLLAGILVGPLIFHARMVSLALRRLHVHRRLPRRIHAHEPLHVRVGVVNKRKRLGAWLLRVRDSIRYLNGSGLRSQPATAVEIAVPLVEPEGETWVSYRAHLTQRGRYEFGPFSLTTRFPLGLLECGRTYDKRQTLVVCPRLGRVTAEWGKLVLGEQLGNQAPRARQGLTEAEFYGLREWRAGDSPRWVHWRTSARISTLAVRQFERQRQPALALLLDLWLPPQPTPEQRLRLELAVSFAATAITDLGRHGGARITMAIAGAQAECHSGAATSGLVDDFVERLATVQGGEDTLTQTIPLLLAHWPNGTPGVVLSTRDQPSGRPFPTSGLPPDQMLKLHSLIWIDVGSRDVERFFRLEPPIAPALTADKKPVEDR